MAQSADDPDRAAPIPHRRLAAVYGGYFAFVGAYSPYLSLYLESIGLTASRIGLLIAEMQLMRIFAPNAWAWFADRTGRRVRTLQLSLLAGALTFCGFFGVSSFAGLAVVMGVHAFCSGAVTPLTESVTLAHLRGNMGRYGAIRLWGSVGFIASVLAVGWQLDHFPVGTLLVTVLALLAATFAASLVLPDVRTDAKADGASIAEALTRRETVLLLVACFLMTVAHGPLYAFFSIDLAAHGYSKTAIGMLWALGVVVEIIVFWLMPRWAGRLSMERVLLASFAAAVIRFLMIGWLIDSVTAIIVAQVLHAATFGSYHVAALALIHRTFDRGRETRGQALYSSVSYGAGGMVGAAGGGWLWDTVGPAATMSAASAAALLGLIALWMRRKMSATSAHAGPSGG